MLYNYSKKIIIYLLNKNVLQVLCRYLEPLLYIYYDYFIILLLLLNGVIFLLIRKYVEIYIIYNVQYTIYII